MKFYLLPLLFFLCFLSPSAVGFSEETSHETQAPTQEHQDEHESEFGHLFDRHHELTDRMDHETDTFHSKFLNMLFILGLLIAFMFIASWSLKRLMKTKVTSMNTSGEIKILETRYLSPRATLYLIELHQKTFLIAESPGAVTYLAETKFPS